MASKTTVGLIGAAVTAAAIATTVFLTSSNTLPPGGDVQAAINSAKCGDTIALQAGASYPANLTLPNKNCTDSFITIISSGAGDLPEGQRIGPAQFELLAHLESVVQAEPVVKTVAGTGWYKFVGIEFSTKDDSIAVYDLVRLGEPRQTQTTVDSVPRQIIIDRSYIHGWSTQNVQRGVSLNCRECGVINSYISEIHGEGYDTQAICAWNTPGPFYAINNYLEAAGENVLVGGADPASEELLPANGEFRRNYIFKPMSWKVGDPSYAGRHWTVKNLVEIKACKGCTIDGNVIENNWADGQSGIPILFTVRNQEGTAPYSIITSTSFTNNTVKNAAGALNLLGSDNEKPSQRSHGLLIKNNIFDQITSHFLTMNGYDSVVIENNTHLQTCGEGCNIMTLYGNPSANFIYRNNVTRDRPYGIFGDGGLIGQPALDKWTPGAIVVGNVIAAPYNNGKDYPGGNDYPAELTITSDYRTPYTGRGAFVDVLLAAQAGAVASVPTPAVSPSSTPTPTPTPTTTPVTSPSPSPIPSPTPQPTPSPSPSPSPKPSPTVLPICRSGQFVGSPPTCRCITGMRGNSGKCR